MMPPAARALAIALCAWAVVLAVARLQAQGMLSMASAGGFRPVAVAAQNALVSCSRGSLGEHCEVRALPALTCGAALYAAALVLAAAWRALSARRARP